ncbi:MAG: hypothetical protein L0177_01075 [Chloroflexi bacterium]|nr:hypothetical protein [Chloroflexota bacterium]
MTVVVAGMASGLIMALVFITAGVITLFSLAKAPPSWAATVFEKFPPNNMALAGMVMAYPVWSLVGMILGLIYHVSATQVPGGGLGSPNMVYTIAILAATGVAATPLLVILRRFIPQTLVLTLAFVGVFGWFLPYFVSAG